MSITAVIVLFAVFWFLSLFIFLPLRIKSQSETGEVVPGTPASAPDEPMIKRKMIWASISATILTVIVCAVIMSDLISVQDIDFFDRMGGP